MYDLEPYEPEETLSEYKTYELKERYKWLRSNMEELSRRIETSINYSFTWYNRWRLWAGFEFYKDYMDMKEQIQLYVSPDLSDIEKYSRDERASKYC